MRLTPSAQLIRLGLVEWSLALGFFEILRIWPFAWLGLGGIGYGQRLWLGVLFAYHLANDFTHQHLDHPEMWGAAVSPT